MIEKILNNYFARKLLEEIKWSFIVRDLDYRFKDDKYNVFVETKQKKYANEYYRPIICINKKESFRYMCDLDEFRKHIDKIIEEYRKEEG
jgi:hypothetical protein